MHGVRLLFVTLWAWSSCYGLVFGQERGCFRCGDQCVAMTQVCDGRPDCADGLDETAAQCRALTPDCPLPAFRCDYGACIRGTARCDGQVDCADGSDERGCREEPVSAPGASAGSNVSGAEVCRASPREECDGWLHCADGSDETAALCSKRPPCPPDTFRCRYGACVHANARCNGLRDCADASDEDSAICDTRKNNTNITCKMPSGVPANSRLTVKLYRGYMWLMYSCESGYKLTEFSPSVCFAGTWDPSPPTRFDTICKRKSKAKSIFSVLNPQNYFRWMSY